MAEGLSNRKAKSLGVYAGSFDPPTIGHLWMIEQGVRLFEECVVAIGINPEKKSAFGVEDRLTMLRETVRGLRNLSVTSFSNRYLIDYARSIGATHILRGIRSPADFEYERAMRNINSDLDPNICTVPDAAAGHRGSEFEHGERVDRACWMEEGGPEVCARACLQTFVGVGHVNAATPERWAALWIAAHLTGDAGSWYERLSNAYSESQRHYHTLQHLSECLREFDSARNQASDPATLELAIWFHDAIYKPRASDNEERSAEIARDCLAASNATPGMTENVCRLVLDTKAHIASGHAASALLLDIDLSILGQPETRFDEYERQIREEYSWVPGIIFKPKRAAILRGFLDRPRIYNTEMFEAKYERAARANIERSLGKGRCGVSFKSV